MNMGNAKNKLKHKAKKTQSDSPSILNRRARHDFEILDTLVAGMVLTGTEVKSLRLGRGQLSESFVRIDKSMEAFLFGMTIPHYEFGNINNHNPDRTRKLLLQKKELYRWKSKAEKDKLTIIPLKLFWKQNTFAKLEIGLAKRKSLHNKRETLRRKAVEMDVKRELKNY